MRLANSYTRAYSYFRAAAKSLGTSADWVNLGVHRMVDECEQAEDIQTRTIFE